MKFDARTVPLVLTCIVLSGCAPMDLIGTLESSCESSLPTGNWTRLDGADDSVHVRFAGHHHHGGDQLSISYSSKDGSAAQCWAGKGGFFPKAGWLLVADQNGEISELTID